jgi:hypothetical protein
LGGEQRKLSALLQADEPTQDLAKEKGVTVETILAYTFMGLASFVTAAQDVDYLLL